MQPMVIASFLRLVTHPKIFMHPTPMTDALNFIDALLEAADIEPATLGDEWSNNDVPNAWLAAAAIHQSEHVVSFDADFRRLLPRNQFTRLSL